MKVLEGLVEVHDVHRCPPPPVHVWQILADFVREPTTYVVVGVEDIEGSSNADTCGEFGRGGEATAIAPKAPESCFGETGSNTSRGLSSPGGAMFGAEIKHPMAWQMTAFSLKPAPRIWDGL